MICLSEKVSKILRRLLEQAGLTEADLAKKTEIPQPTVHRLLRGKTPDPRIATLQTLATHFGITLDQLIGEKPVFFEDGTPSKLEEVRRVPIISWKDAVDYQSALQMITKNKGSAWEVTCANISELSFALRVKGKASSIRFMENSILIVDPLRTPKDGAYVIVQLQNQLEAVLKQLVVEIPQQYLRSIVQPEKLIPLSEYDKVLGVIIETRMELPE